MIGKQTVRLALTALLGFAVPAAAEGPVQTAPTGGEMVASRFAQAAIPAGWNWASLSGLLLAASPNVPAAFFALADDKLADDMAFCIDLSQTHGKETPAMREEIVSERFAEVSAELAAVSDPEAKQASFVKWREAGRHTVLVSVLPSAYGASTEFTGVVFMEGETVTIHLVCKAMFDKDKGAYTTRTAMKGFLAMLDSFTPL